MCLVCSWIPWLAGTMLRWMACELEVTAKGITNQQRDGVYFQLHQGVLCCFWYFQSRTLPFCLVALRHGNRQFTNHREFEKCYEVVDSLRSQVSHFLILICIFAQILNLLVLQVAHWNALLTTLTTASSIVLQDPWLPFLHVFKSSDVKLKYVMEHVCVHGWFVEGSKFMDY